MPSARAVEWDSRAVNGRDGQTDEALMAWYRATGDDSVLRILMQRHMGAALAIAASRLRAYGLAEDAVQEAFLRAIRSAAAYDPRRPFGAWFYTILRNVCTDFVRMESRYRLRLREVAAALPERGSEAPSPDYEPLRAAMRRLRPPDREILVLRMVEEMSFREIGASLGCAEESAKKRGQRALRRLQRLMREERCPFLRFRSVSGIDRCAERRPCGMVPETSP